MEGNWTAQPDASMGPPMDAAAAGDWWTQVKPEARQRIVDTIMDTLKRHLSVSVPEGATELRKIAAQFEEKIYTAATSQSDYLQKISLKMVSMETKSQQSAPVNPAMPNSGDVNQNPADPGSLGMQSQVNNHVQQLAVPNRQALLSQNLPNNSSAAVPGSSGLGPALPSITGLGQSNISGVSQASNLQNMSGISQGYVNNYLAQGAQPDIYANPQRQMQGRQQQQQIISQRQQQQSQNPLLYKHQLQQQTLNRKLQQQQQAPMPPNQLQSTRSSSLMQISSGHQSNQSNIQQTQAASMQSAQPTGFQQGQLNQIQQSVPSLLQQNTESVSRQQQAQPLHQQVPSLQQQAPPISQQTTLPPQQQHMMGQQGNMSNMQQNQLLGQKTSIADIQQQQRLPIKQNILSVQQQQQQRHQMMNQQSLALQQQQQQLGSQNNMSGQQQQHQSLGRLSSISNMQPHQRTIIMHNNAAQQQQQQQTHQSSLSLLQSQGHHSQHQSPQQQLMSEFQPKFQKQLQMQQQSNPLQWEMQQRIQGSGPPLLKAQNAMEQKPFIQAQRGLPDVSSNTSMEATAQTVVLDWQEECYEKIKSMKEQYLAELTEFHQKIAMKLQQQEALILPGKQSKQHERLKKGRTTLECLIALLQINKNSIPVGMKEKLPVYEKHILSMLPSYIPKKIGLQVHGQPQFQQHNVGNSHPISQQQPSQISQLQLPDNHANQLQQINLQGSGTSLQPSGASSVQHVSMPLSTAHQNVSNTLQPTSTMDSVQESSFNNSVQPGAIGSGQQGGLGSLQNSMGTPQQTNMNAISQSAANSLQINGGPMQPNAHVLQQQHSRQEQQQLLQSQQMKQQLQQRHLQQQKQLMLQQQKQQLPQQQQPLQQHFQQQQSSQLPVQQVHHHHSMNELNELKARQGSGIKSGVYEYSDGQRHNFYNQLLKTGASYPVSSPQNLQASSPQISHHSSPQIDQNGLLSSIPKDKAPLQSANSPLVVTPSTAFTPSPIHVDSVKPLSSISSAGHVGHQQAPGAQTQPHSIAVSTPGISASPLLAECANQDGNQANVPATSKTSASERPIDRLIEVVQSLTPKTLSSAVADIGSDVSMIDWIAGPAPGNGSRAAAGVAMTKCRLLARNFMAQDGGATAKKRKRHTSAMPLNNVSSPGSINDSFELSQLESTAPSRIKRLKHEANHALLEEIREINRKLIDTEVDVSDEDVDSVAAASELGEGTVVKCSYAAVALCPDLKARFASSQTPPIMPLRLLVPANYPKRSPVLLDDPPAEPSNEFGDISTKARAKFSASLPCVSQPMSLGEMAKMWDACARKAILEYAQRFGGGSFSSANGSWGNCVGA